MGRVADFEHALDELYLSVADAGARARLPFTLAGLFGAGACSFWTFDAATGAPDPGLLTTAPPELIADYVSHYHQSDPWRTPAMRAQIGQPMHGAALIADADLSRSSYHNEFGRQMGTFHLLGGAMPADPAEAGTLIAITVHRPEASERFEDAEHRTMGLLMPHIRRVVQLRRAVGPGGDDDGGLPSATAVAFIDAMPDAVLLTDRGGRVQHANARADAADAAGIVHLRAGGVLAAGTPDQTAALLRMIGDAATGGAGGSVRIGPGAFATVSPVPPGLGARMDQGPGQALVVLRLIPEPSERFVQHVQDLFRLPRAETETACAIAAGQSPDQIARLRGVRLSTIRTLLQRTMGRTGADSLRTLAVLLAVADQGLPVAPSDRR